MSDPLIPILFTGFTGLILAAVLGVTLRDLRLRKRARERWKRTSGHILEFGLTGSTPEVTYTYTVDSKEHQGSGITLNKPAKDGTGPSLKKQLYTDDYGRLRYPPGKSVEVYYDPDIPGSSALALEIGIHRGVIIALSLIFAGAVTVLLKFLGVIDLPFVKHPLIGPALLGTVSAIFLIITLRVLLIHLRSKDYSSVEGRVLETEVRKRTSKNGTSYTLAIKYEYHVDGIRYFSRQIYATGATVSTRLEKIENEARALRENPKIRVWYHPRTPWTCHLRQGPFAMVLFLMCATVIIGAIALKILLK